MEQYKKFLSRIEHNCLSMPDKVAYKIRQVSYTYAQLYDMSGHIASGILTHISAERIADSTPIRVALNLPRDSYYLPCMMACIRLGISYVPIETTMPDERREFIISDANAAVVINGANIDRFLQTPIQSELPCLHKQHSEMYLLYTSGTTGSPKGVSISYASVLAFITALANPHTFNISSESRILHFTSYCFDVSISEIFSSFYYGATLIVALEEDRRDVQRLLRLIKTERVTFIAITPAVLLSFPDYNMPSVDCISIAGEPMPVTLTQRLHGNIHFRCINAYGPTEATVLVTYHIINGPEDNLSIGVPFPEVKCLVVDKDRQPVGIGQEGELLIGGKQLCNGYWNRPELNRESFCIIDNERYYFSGDIVRLQADGSFHFIGRKDSQVKINGYRIELSEISNRIEMHPRVAQCLIRVEESGRQKAIVAYVCTNDGNAELADVREYASHHLTPYMMPSFWNHVKEFKLNINRKIDRSQLRNEAWLKMLRNDGPLTNNEQTMAHEVAMLLGVDSVNIDADLFTELGVSSLQIMQIPIDLELACLKISVEDIYRHRTIRKIACNHQFRISFWYEDPALHPERPVIIFITGYPHFGYCEDLCKRFTDQYNIFVIEGFHTFLNFDMTTTPELIELYKLLVAPIIAEYNVVAYVGYCFAGEQALLLAHDLYNDSETKPLVVCVDGEVLRDKVPEHYIPLRWPALTDQQNETRRLMDIKLITTVPDNHVYNGPVAAFCSEFFDEQQAITPEDQLTVPEDNMQRYRERLTLVPKLWRKVYPQADVIMFPGTHFTCMHNEACLNMVSIYVHNYLKCSVLSLPEREQYQDL